MSVISPRARICSNYWRDEVRLLTNNPKKVEILTEAELISERVPLIVGRNPNNEHYLDYQRPKWVTC